MRVALCQINSIVGDFQHNGQKILSFYQKALADSVDLVVFPELFISGYPPQDLVLEAAFIERNLDAVNRISREIGSVPAIFGFIRKQDSHLFNSAAVVASGRCVATYDKALLPTYDVFDEDRYFTPGRHFEPIPIPLANGPVKIGIEICEDLWDEGYECKVTDELVKNGAEVIINISASPFSEGKGFERMDLITKKVNKLAVPFLYCNLVGAQDELIFDGHSLSYDKNGNLLAEGRQFEEEIVRVDVNEPNSGSVEPRPYDREQELFNGLVLGIRDYFRKTGHTQTVIGLSGGIDSALTTCLAVEALGNKHVTCVSMPSRFSSQHSIDDTATLTENLGVKLVSIPIEELMENYDDVLGESFEGLKRDVTEENIQARIRGNILMAFSNKLGSLVLSTGNKTELALGYCTLYGDMSGGLAAISDLSKADVYAVARWYNKFKGEEIIPNSIFIKRPSAELSEGQVDPFDYDIVSPLVDEIVQNHRAKKELIDRGYDSDLIDDVYGFIRRAEFKRRQAAPGLRITSKAFGVGRRYPIVNHFDGG